MPPNENKLFRKARHDAKIAFWPHDALRHSWVTYRYAFTGDGALTASEAGHDQAILHKHYRALSTKAVAQEWFAIVPEDIAEGPIEIGVAEASA